MKSLIHKTIRNIYYKIVPDSVLYNGTRLPAKYLRYCGSNFRDNGHYYNSAISEATRLINKMNANSSTKVLDVGCGVGRLGIGLKQVLPDIGRYTGVDVSVRAIDWCKNICKLIQLIFSLYC